MRRFGYEPPIMTHEMMRLKKLEERVAYLVTHVEGVVTREENDELDWLRKRTGFRYDPIDQCWKPDIRPR